MKASLHGGSLPHSVRWAVLAAALLLLSFGASARGGGGHDHGGHGGWSHAGAGHDGDRHAGGRHAGGRHGGRSHHGRSHHRGNVFLGLGLGFWPSWYEPYAYGYGYGYPQAGIYTPPVYVEQADEVQSAYWYYCADARAYYPQVTQCSSGWLRVIPGPANQ